MGLNWLLLIDACRLQKLRRNAIRNSLSLFSSAEELHDYKELRLGEHLFVVRVRHLPYFRTHLSRALSLLDDLLHLSRRHALRLVLIKCSEYLLVNLRLLGSDCKVAG